MFTKENQLNYVLGLKGNRSVTCKHYKLTKNTKQRRPGKDEDKKVMKVKERKWEGWTRVRGNFSFKVNYSHHIDSFPEKNCAIERPRTPQ